MGCQEMLDIRVLDALHSDGRGTTSQLATNLRVSTNTMRATLDSLTGAGKVLHGATDEWTITDAGTAGLPPNLRPA